MHAGFCFSKQSVCLPAALLVGVLAVSGRAMGGQQLTTDATIIGQVTDEQGGVLPGVTVTATGPALQVPNVTAVTDERGEYRLTPLPIGTYVVEYALSGFQTVRREGIRLTAGFTAKIDITLSVGGLEETITVSGGAPLVDVARTAAMTQLTREALDTIPTGGHGYVGILMMVPGARPALEVGGDRINTNPSLDSGSQGGGGGISQSWQSVDGVATKNPRITESGNYFDFSAAEEAMASTLGHDASVPNRGLNVNVVLASGSNAFHGKALYGGTSSRFETKQNVQGGGGGGVSIRDDARGELGGRAIRDKLWFWVGVTKNRNHRDVQECFQPDGSLCDLFQEAFFVTTKWTWQMSPSNKLTGFIMRNRGPQDRDQSPLTPHESRRVFFNEVDVFKAEWQGLKGNSLVMGANWGGWEGHSGTICPDGKRSLAVKNVDLSTCAEPGIFTEDTVLGTTRGLHDETGGRLLEGRFQARTFVGYYKPDWFYGNHDIKAGFDFFTAPQNRHNVGRGGGGNYGLFLQNGVADQIQFWNYPVHPDLVTHYYGTYVADSWTIGRRLTLNLGIRHAYDVGYEEAVCRDAADGPSAAVFPAACFGKVSMPAYNTWAPRVRAAYDLTGDGKTVIKGGWGRYQQMKSADEIQLVARNVLSGAVFTWHDTNNNVRYDDGEVDLRTNGPDFVQFVGARAGFQGGIVNPDATTPYTDEYMLQFERQLTQTMAVRATGVERRYGNAQRIANDLRPYSVYTIPYTNQDPGPDGRVGTADDTGKFITYYDYPANLVGAAFARAKIVNDPKANEAFHTIEVSVTKRLSNNWQFMVSHSATKQDIPLPANFPPFNSVDPNSDINAANNTWEWLSRASGSYLFPYSILASANFEHRSGNPTARTARFANRANVGSITLRVEPIGSIRLPNINLLTLRAEKRFNLPRGQQVAVRTNVYNALNTDAATSMTVSSGANFGRITARVLPRIADFQAEYRF